MKNTLLAMILSLLATNAVADEIFATDGRAQRKGGDGAFVVKITSEKYCTLNSDNDFKRTYEGDLTTGTAYTMVFFTKPGRLMFVEHEDGKHGKFAKAIKYDGKEKRIYAADLETGKEVTFDLKPNRVFLFGPVCDSKKIIDIGIEAKDNADFYIELLKYYNVEVKNEASLRTQLTSVADTQAKCIKLARPTIKSEGTTQSPFATSIDKARVQVDILNTLLRGRPVGVTAGKTQLQLVGYDLKKMTFLCLDAKYNKKEMLIKDIIAAMEKNGLCEMDVMCEGRTLLTEKDKENPNNYPYERVLTFDKALAKTAAVKYEGTLQAACEDLFNKSFITVKVGEGVDSSLAVKMVTDSLPVRKLVWQVCDAAKLVPVQTGEWEITLQGAAEAEKYAAKVVAKEAPVVDVAKAAAVAKSLEPKKLEAVANPMPIKGKITKDAQMASILQKKVSIKINCKQQDLFLEISRQTNVQMLDSSKGSLRFSENADSIVEYEAKNVTMEVFMSGLCGKYGWGWEYKTNLICISE